MSPSGSPADPARVLHVNDCAFTTTHLLTEADRRGLPWSYQPLAAPPQDWSGVGAQARRAALGARWVTALATRAARVDLLHVHSGTVVAHTRLVPRRFVLHLHGSDVRSMLYRPEHRATLLWGLRHAAAVLYSTPDLAEHALPHRPDARLLPVPLPVASLPTWAPGDRPRVVFASRWEAVKGLDTQLEVAAGLRRALGADVELVGLDWGEGADQARAAGVRLVPRCTHPEFLALLAGAHVVVGQSSGMLAASELEAIGIGVPVVAALNPSWYPDRAPVLGGREADSMVAAVVDALADPVARSAELGGRAWLTTHHDVGRAVDTLTALYERLTR
ncbi:MAG: hypothetical protein ABI181_13250 [Mycobacteriaceae bacterium]